MMLQSLGLDVCRFRLKAWGVGLQFITGFLDDIAGVLAREHMGARILFSLTVLGLHQGTNVEWSYLAPRRFKLPHILQKST